MDEETTKDEAEVGTRHESPGNNWHTQLSHGFDALVAFASNEIGRSKEIRRRSEESETRRHDSNSPKQEKKHGSKSPNPPSEPRREPLTIRFKNGRICPPSPRRDVDETRKDPSPISAKNSESGESKDNSEQSEMRIFRKGPRTPPDTPPRTPSPDGSCTPDSHSRSRSSSPASNYDRKSRRDSPDYYSQDSRSLHSRSRSGSPASSYESQNRRDYKNKFDRHFKKKYFYKDRGWNRGKYGKFKPKGKEWDWSKRNVNQNSNQLFNNAHISQNGTNMQAMDLAGRSPVISNGLHGHSPGIQGINSNISGLNASGPGIGNGSNIGALNSQIVSGMANVNPSGMQTLSKGPQGMINGVIPGMGSLTTSQGLGAMTMTGPQTMSLHHMNGNMTTCSQGLLPGISNINGILSGSSSGGPLNMGNIPGMQNMGVIKNQPGMGNINNVYSTSNGASLNPGISMNGPGNNMKNGPILGSIPTNFSVPPPNFSVPPPNTNIHPPNGMLPPRNMPPLPNQQSNNINHQRSGMKGPQSNLSCPPQMEACRPSNLGPISMGDFSCPPANMSNGNSNGMRPGMSLPLPGMNNMLLPHNMTMMGCPRGDIESKMFMGPANDLMAGARAYGMSMTHPPARGPCMM